MAVNPLVLLIPMLAVLVFLGTQGKVGFRLRNILLLVLFLFATVALNPAQGTFYSLLIFGIFILSELGFIIDKKSGVNFLGNKLTGTTGIFITIVLGIGLMLVIRSLAGGGNAASVIGVPQTLAVSSGVLNFMAPTLVSSLGYVENIFWFGLTGVTLALLAFTPAGIVLGPFLTLLAISLVSLSFGLFHVSVFALSGIIFATIAFMIFSLSNQFVGPEPANVAHYGHNALESLPLQVAV